MVSSQNRTALASPPSVEITWERERGHTFLFFVQRSCVRLCFLKGRDVLYVGALFATNTLTLHFY